MVTMTTFKPKMKAAHHSMVTMATFKPKVKTSKPPMGTMMKPVMDSLQTSEMELREKTEMVISQRKRMANNPLPPQVKKVRVNKQTNPRPYRRIKLQRPRMQKKSNPTKGAGISTH